MTATAAAAGAALAPGGRTSERHSGHVECVSSQRSTHALQNVCEHDRRVGSAAGAV